jgi:hypothetical protein
MIGLSTTQVHYGIYAEDNFHVWTQWTSPYSLRNKYEGQAVQLTVGSCSGAAVEWPVTDSFTVLSSISFTSFHLCRICLTNSVELSTARQATTCAAIQ